MWNCCHLGACSLYTIHLIPVHQFTVSLYLVPYIYVGCIHVCLVVSVTCHLRFLQNYLLCATAVNESQRGVEQATKIRVINQHRKLTLEMKILLPLLPQLDPTTFRSQVLHSVPLGCPCSPYTALFFFFFFISTWHVSVYSSCQSAMFGFWGQFSGVVLSCFVISHSTVLKEIWPEEIRRITHTIVQGNSFFSVTVSFHGSENVWICAGSLLKWSTN